MSQTSYGPASVWTPERDGFMRAFVPGHTEAEIRTAFAERFGVELTVSQVANRKHALGVRSGTHGGRFERGHAGGFIDEEHKAAFLEAGRRTRFRKGQVPANLVPVGSERVSKGYVWVKVREHYDPDGHNDWRDLWVPKHRHVWELRHGPLPDGSMVVFADHDNRNFDPENLVAMTKAQHSTICHQHIPYHDAESLRTAMAMTDLAHATFAAECRERTCLACGRRFVAEQPNQRRCRECIDAGRTAPRKRVTTHRGDDQA